jgi:selenocysteine-specific elongation factor
MPYIIGTAGHIDHGKTSLVKALTGQDTDRLKEEKERGISIDLGFASFELPDGSVAGVVDVPGHERFIRNMLAGAHGIDLVLFTVAADDGVMPQTVEHLDIVHLLGVTRAIFVITKADLASADRLRDVERDIRQLVAGTSLDGSPVVRFSLPTGQGLRHLRDLIARTLQQWQSTRGSGYFRLPVDRAFVLPGHGVVVTGTAIGGQVAVGDRVRALPGDWVFRVRSLQVHNQPQQTARCGQRVALNLSGSERASIVRGHVIADERLTRTSDRFDVSLEVRPSTLSAIKSHQRVRVHVGTAERLGKVVLLDGRARVEAKETVLAQIAVSEAVLVLRGDRFVVRDEQAQRTLGGGVVVHPWARKPTRGARPGEERLRELRDGSVPVVARRFLDEIDEFAVPLEPLSQFLNVADCTAAPRIDSFDGIRALALESDTLYTTERKWTNLRESVTASLREFHAARPLVPGMEMEALREKVARPVEARVFRAAVEQLALEQALVREGNLIRLRDHQVRLHDQDRLLADKVSALLLAQKLAPPDLKQLEQEVGITRARLLELIRVLERAQSVVKVAPELYFSREGLDEVRAVLCRHLDANGSIAVGMFRDLLGTSRKYTVPLLEYFDREGLTVRIGDVRRLRKRVS